MPRVVQPDLVSCGPSCLEIVARYHGDARSSEVFAGAVSRNHDGGTLAVHLANAALGLGYRVALFPFGVKVFDPTWWSLSSRELVTRVEQRALSRPEVEQSMYRAWIELLHGGGRVFFREPTANLVVRALERGHPLIAGLSATWLYREARERQQSGVPDPLAGEPTGHFVVIHGYSGRGLHFHVVDPFPHPPLGKGRYPVSAARLLTAILLGDATNDAAILEISPRRERA